MYVLGIIPARYNSSRFPGKPLLDLEGKSMIHRVYERVVDSDLFQEVVVATDDVRIYNHVLDFGGKVLMTSESHSTGTDRCAEVIQQFPEAEIVVNIQGDEPLISGKQLASLLEIMHREEVQIGTLVIPFQSLQEVENNNRIKVVTDANGKVLYFSRSVIPNVEKWNTNAEAMDFLKHIGVYAFRRDVLIEVAQLEVTELEKMESLEQLRWLYHGYSIHIAKTTIETPNIDTPEDVQKVLDLL
ncbi:MAG: hypothetical protein RL264_2018 [Bacteroidota bacterium]|jgi:3-deoxy-manno-octulosonate cytidylyltransferase (CMP-KDO synthetase)